MRSQIEGFTVYGIDAVIKFGGSLTRDLVATKLLIEGIAACAQLGHRLIVIPGGGRPDKAIEEIDREQPLAPETAHRATAMAQDQTGLILCDRGFSGKLQPCETLRECRIALDAGRVPVLLPARLLMDLDPVAMTWDVTSDAVAAWFAWLVDATRIAILTDVDGVYRAGCIGVESDLIRNIAPTDLLEMGHTSVDRCAAAWISDKDLEAAVINGRHPERLRHWLGGETFVGTHISNRVPPGEIELCSVVP
ncbi:MULTISPECIES: aspartate kinase [unclassified Neorhizobium]|uniref:amino acid kinase family protein n=1 Tax=unclassified Neorhizobium TaxID=2629175 RepID=UPI001FF3AC2B|nr:MULTISPECIES: aspartate kinase [unclassified Neorhizobium]MCJ9669031.1 aspartate kinase [Neorhizobium sp. SHOUNA12B]MCJ9744985.1 aspartate kinase [Neorhizobium sp. SHOUNA12A]